MPGEEPSHYARRAARAKAEGVVRALPAQAADAPVSARPLVIAADTIVVLNGRILGKPRDAEDAFAMLSALSGMRHTVSTGCALLTPGAADCLTFAVSSHVVMWDCPPELLRAYARSGEPLDKAGAYAVQGAGAFLVKSLEGSWTNVVGLPLAELVRELLQQGAIRPS